MSEVGGVGGIGGMGELGGYALLAGAIVAVVLLVLLIILLWRSRRGVLDAAATFAAEPLGRTIGPASTDGAGPKPS